MSKNKSKQKQGGNMSPDNVANVENNVTANVDDTPDVPEVEMTEGDTTEGDVKDPDSDNKMCIDPDIEEIELNADPIKVPETDDADVIQLYKLMNDYIKNIQLGAGIGRTEENIIKFVNLGKFIAKRNKIKLIEMFYVEIVAGTRSNLMAPDLVFQFINKVNDDQKKSVEVLYTALLALRDYLEKPKVKVGFPLDVKKIEQSFGGNSLTMFIKKFIG